MIRTIVRYAIVKDGALNSLVDAVNLAIEDGWEPYGQPFTTSSTTGYLLAWHQPIVLYSYSKG